MVFLAALACAASWNSPLPWFSTHTLCTGHCALHTSSVTQHHEWHLRHLAQIWDYCTGHSSYRLHYDTKSFALTETTIKRRPLYPYMIWLYICVCINRSFISSIYGYIFLQNKLFSFYPWDMVSKCSHGCSGPHYVDQVAPNSQRFTYFCLLSTRNKGVCHQAL